MTIALKKWRKLEVLLTDVALDLVTEQIEIGSKDPTTISNDELEDIKDRVTDFLEGIIEDYIYGCDLNDDLGRAGDE